MLSEMSADVTLGFPVSSNVWRLFTSTTTPRSCVGTRRISLECELLDRHRFRTHADARLAIFDFIEGWYNARRRHSALDHLSPLVYESTHATGDRTVAPRPTIAQGGAMSVSPSWRV